jgi:hypothetical protein
MAAFFYFDLVFLRLYSDALLVKYHTVQDYDVLKGREILSLSKRPIQVSHNEPV